jgi:hypothetical protein
LGHDEGYRPSLYFADDFLSRCATVGFCNIVRDVMHEHQEPLQRGLTGQECNLPP